MVAQARLRELRLARGIKASQFGRRLGIDPSLVLHIEAGRIAPYPRFRRLSAKVLGVSQREIYGPADGVKAKQEESAVAD